ncbi:methyltransferase domain-containing protein [Melittangium boletus]|uniref:SAM-dependent methyltransferase n=1 Tax=Melittangium boletus DSM 14713 TaxID=1294270 RepID=A0A250IIY4_9BACT|nr:class I SAM-dependent methyltransferase [Melittangium boletus]ATB31122.1 SAM-dependent methyltransferase [Melittangium boletus DSM 14713]
MRMNLMGLRRHAWGDVQARLRHLPRMNPLRNLMAEVPELASPAPRDTPVVDAARVDAYRHAIERYVGPERTVVDVCTGNGLRAILAARCNPGKLYAVDASRNLDTAQWVACRNGFTDIEFVRADISRFQPAKKVDVLLHEQVGDGLFDAGLIPKLLDARDRLLAPGGRILPNRFDVFFEPVQLRDEARVPFIWDQRLPNVDFSCLQILRDTLDPAYFTRIIRPQDVERSLCEASPVFTLDLETLRAGSLPKRLELERPVVRGGRMDGLCLFYRAHFDSSLSYDTFPERPRACAPVMLLRTDARDFARYETIRLELSLPDLADVTTWRWNSL